MNHKPSPVDELVSDQEFYGRKIYHWLLRNDGHCEDIKIIAEALEITQEQLREGLNWCAENNLIEFYIH